MRISTGMIYETNVRSLQTRTSALLHTQQQVSSGRRILTPSDDPVAAARALEINQALEINNQYDVVQGYAKDSLSLVDTQLGSANELLSKIRELAIKGSDATLTDADRLGIARGLRTDFDALIGLANSTDGTGQYLFSGYQSDTQPFSGSVANGVIYSGDDGLREMRISSSRKIPVSASGNDVFMSAKNGNGTFVAAAKTTPPVNTGSGIVTAETLLDVSKWNSSANSGELEIRFWDNNPPLPATTAGLYYDLVDTVTGRSLFTDTASTSPATYTHAFNSGDAIPFSGLAPAYVDFGASVKINGTPANGDVFTVQNSITESVFSTIGRLINALETPAAPGASGNSSVTNIVASVVRNLDRSNNIVLTTRADIGTRLNEIDMLSNSVAQNRLNFTATLSALQDIDYNTAITQLTQQQTELEAAQKSFLKISGLSLFNYV